MALRAQKHRHERSYAVHVWMLSDDILHQLGRGICLPGVVQTKRAKRSHESVISVTGRIELAERFVKLAHVHVNERSTVTRHHVRRRVQTHESIVTAQRSTILTIQTVQQRLDEIDYR